MPSVNPDILRWARETAGLAPEQAVEKLQLRPAHGATALERLTALEVGEALPTRPMLVKMSKNYRRPLLAFYLASPPRRGDRGQDFRTLPEDRSQEEHALLDVLIRNVRARQSMVRAALEDEDETPLLSFVGSKRTSDGIPAVVSSIQETLDVSLSDFRARSTSEEAFGFLRSRAEKIGIFVLLIGDLGSHHTAFKLEIFRGFALADEVAPFVVINDRDSRAAWSFTLIHELAHIWLGQTGVSGERGELTVERFCNDVAGEFLLPREELEELSLENASDIRSIEHQIREFTSRRNLSHSMVAYRLYRVGAIDRTAWSYLRETFRNLWQQERHRKRERARKQDGGPNFYVVRGHRVGRALLDLVARMISDGALTTCKAGKVLGVKPKQVQTLLETKERGGAPHSEQD